MGLSTHADIVYLHRKLCWSGPSGVILSICIAPQQDQIYLINNEQELQELIMNKNCSFRKLSKIWQCYTIAMAKKWMQHQRVGFEIPVPQRTRKSKTFCSFKLNLLNCHGLGSCPSRQQAYSMHFPRISTAITCLPLTKLSWKQVTLRLTQKKFVFIVFLRAEG